MGRDWVVIGAGGHGREVADVIRLLGGTVLGFLDDDPAKAGRFFGSHPVLGPLEWLRGGAGPLRVALGIGASAMRLRVVERLRAFPRELCYPTLVHPGSQVGGSVFLGEGTLVQAGCVLTCDIRVGDFVVLNSGVSLAHDVEVGDFATLAPGARMAGNVTVGPCAEVGMGTLVIQGQALGAACVTGAGSVVVRDVPPGKRVLGVPARIRELL